MQKSLVQVQLNLLNIFYHILFCINVNFATKNSKSKEALGVHTNWCKENLNRKGKSNFTHNLSGSENFKKLNKYRDDLFCIYCGRQCKSLNSLKQHEIRCKQNPNHIICYGNKGNMPKHISGCENKFICIGNIALDITNKQLEEYRLQHTTCEICGKTIEESVKWQSKFAQKIMHRSQSFN